MERVTVLLIIFGIRNKPCVWRSRLCSRLHAAQCGVHPFSEKFNAPGFRIEDVDSNQVKLKDYRGKIVLLFFWMTW